jgi:hypothetical protein
MEIDDDVLKPVTFEKQEIPHDERRAGNGKQRLGDGIRERSQARAQAGRENHRSHDALAKASGKRHEARG